MTERYHRKMCGLFPWIPFFNGFLLLFIYFFVKKFHYGMKGRV